MMLPLSIGLIGLIAAIADSIAGPLPQFAGRHKSEVLQRMIPASTFISNKGKFIHDRSPQTTDAGIPTGTSVVF